MIPVEAEQMALSQEEEFQSRLFQDGSCEVVSCVSVRKIGSAYSDTTIPKQYYLLLTVNGNDHSDSKIHKVSIKQGVERLNINRSSKLKKLVSVKKISDDHGFWDFEYTWKNGSIDQWSMSPNSVRQFPLFCFAMVVLSGHLTSPPNEKPFDGCPFQLKSIDQAQLCGPGRNWLSSIYNNPSLFRRFGDMKHSLFKSIYRSLATDRQDHRRGSIDAGVGAVASKSGQSGGAAGSGQQGDRDGTGGGHLDLSEEETTSILRYMKECGVTFKQIHLLEEKLIQKQVSLVDSNVQALFKKEEELKKLTVGMQHTITTIKQLQENLKQHQGAVDNMEHTMSDIKLRNQRLAVQDNNHSKLQAKLNFIIEKLELEEYIVITLKEGPFGPSSKYQEALNAAQTLQEKKSLRFSAQIEDMKAVKDRKTYFNKLSEIFCQRACEHLEGVFNSQVKAASTQNAKSLSIRSHKLIHEELKKYDELIRCLELLDRPKFEELQHIYEKKFIKLYANDFRIFFQTLDAKTLTTSKVTHMTSFPTYKLEEFVQRDDDEKSERSEMSHASTLFRGGRAPLGTITEEEDSSQKLAITKAFREALRQLLPLAMSERKFIAEYFAYSNDAQKSTKVAEKMIGSMFSELRNKFSAIIEKADRMDHFNTLHMFIVLEKIIDPYMNKSSFLYGLLLQLQGDLRLLWNAFIEYEGKWIQSQKINVKQAGILLPMSKFPAFCNKMYTVQILAEEHASVLLSANDNAKDAQSGIRIQIDGPKGAQQSGESQTTTRTVQKMTSDLFDWVDKMAESDPKYTDVCMMENYHYFYVIFSKTEGLRALRDQVEKAKKKYRNHAQKYVRWSIHYQCKTLTQFWDKLNHHVQTCDDPQVVNVYVPGSQLKQVLKDNLSDIKKVKIIVDSLFKRMQKHLQKNDILQQTVWRKVTSYYMSHFQRFVENIEKCYQSESVQLSHDAIFEIFKAKYRKHFGLNFEDTSSVGSSVGGSSVASSAITSVAHSGKWRLSMSSQGPSTPSVRSFAANSDSR